MWININDQKPEYGEEVLVWVDGHRSPAWSNSYALVAYLNSFNNEWYEEQHESQPIVGVTHWQKLPTGPKIK